MNSRKVLPLLLTIAAALSMPGCAADRSNAINKNRILAMSPANKQQRTCEAGYALACESTQGHIRYCSCLDREMLRDVIPPDPAR